MTTKGANDSTTETAVMKVSQEKLATVTNIEKTCV